MTFETRPPIIGVVGPIGVGKTTVAHSLVRTHGYTRLPMAAPLKNMLATIGLTDAQLYGDEKEIPVKLLCGKTPRHAMQTLGTEWRDMIGRDLWLNIWVDQWHNKGKPLAVVDDVRFPHEAKMITDNGGVLIEVMRDKVKNTAAHASEAHELPCEVMLSNNSSKEELEMRICALFKERPSSPLWDNINRMRIKRRSTQ